MFVVKKILEHTTTGSYVVDLGAHLGQETIPVAQHVGPTGKVWAFEPNPRLAAQLRHQTENLANVEVVELGASNEEGDVQFFTTYNQGNDGMSSSFIQYCIEDHYKYYPGIFDNPEIVNIKTVSLDTYFNDVEQIDFIKMDVQGAEPLVLKGAQKILKKHTPPLIMEWLHGVPDEITQWAFDFLKSLGYRIYHLPHQPHRSGLECMAPEHIYSSYLRKIDIGNIFCIRE